MAADARKEAARAAIRKAGQARTRAEREKRRATDELRKALDQGANVGLTVREMERLADVSRQGYYVIRRGGKKAAKR